MNDTPVLRVEGLSTAFATDDGPALAVDGLSYELYPGQTLAVVGESGSGKSVSALSLLGLVPDPPGRVTAGRAWYCPPGAGGKAADGDAVDLLSLPESRLRRLRGAGLGMIFQEPMSSLNPVLSIERQMTETVMEHRGLSRTRARERALEMLRLTGIPEPARRLGQYPHQLSGGMLQRVMIAMALSCEPAVLIADEPTTALDVTIQAQILALIQDLRERFGTAVVLITHDLGVVAEVADRVLVMYAGRKVEEAGVHELFARPQHPYTRGLLGAVPGAGRASGAVSGDRLREIPGLVPPLTRLPPGCRFAPRCALADGRCRAEHPPFAETAPGQWTACWHPGRALPESEPGPVAEEAAP